MSFSVVCGSGKLEVDTESLVESVALQYPESVQSVCPGCDLLLLTDVHPQIMYALGSEFTVSDTHFGGAVATKWTITNWTESRQNMCRFDIHHKVTVTFGVYSTLYSLENDMRILSAKPRHYQHFICLVIARSLNLNWQTMVYMCSSVLQIQYPTFKASQCQANSSIVLMGWQRGSAVSYRAPLVVYDSLQLHTPVRTSKMCLSVKSFNSCPVYVLSFVMRSLSWLQRDSKKRRPVTCLEVYTLPDVTLLEDKQLDYTIDIQEEQLPLPNPLSPTVAPAEEKQEQEEEWVLTVIYEDN